LQAALDSAIARRAKKGEFVTCFDHFDLLQTAVNGAGPVKPRQYPEHDGVHAVHDDHP
jgi:hypothetical protein